MTHEIDLKNWRPQAGLYRKGMAPFIQAGRLRAILVQLSSTFERTRENRNHLAHLLDELQALAVAVEFRHRSWSNDRVFVELEKRQVALVAVDIPTLPHLFPTHAIVTDPELYYVRFHGRNMAGWRSGNMQKRFDYDYSDQELQQWSEQLIAKMAEKARSGMIFFNNHVRGQAPRNARLLTEQPAGRGCEIKS